MPKAKLGLGFEASGLARHGGNDVGAGSLRGGADPGGFRVAEADKTGSQIVKVREVGVLNALNFSFRMSSRRSECPEVALDCPFESCCGFIVEMGFEVVA